MSLSEDRNMVGKPISKTYMGILRIANNLNLVDYTTDAFLSKEYYTLSSDNKFYGKGLNDAINFLSASENIKRFKTADNYTHLKLPVTDSMGNFLNFSLGTSGSIIGSNAETGLYISGSNSNFITLKSNNTLYIGLEERKIPGSKSVKGGSLIIEDGDNIKSAVVIKNNYLHDDDTIVKKSKGENIRTIFPTELSSSSSKKNDIFFYSQENYNYDYNPEDTNSNKDCTISIKNLSDYVHSKVDEYLSTNEAPVPTGTIVNQYCSLDKWFCWDSSTNEIDDFGSEEKDKSKFDGWQGYRPSMYNNSSNYAYFNLINNRAIKTDTQLEFNYKRTTELPPDFKRGYILCDGGPVNFNLVPSAAQGKENKQSSLELFFNLFYVLGYYYHNNKGILPRFHKVIKQNGNYRYSALEWVTLSTVNFDVVYGISMATILMFKALDNEYTKNNGGFDSVDDILEWLSEQKIDDEYVFNVISPSEIQSSLPNNYFKYNNDSLASKNYYINIGREISSFSDKIPYYVYENGRYVLTSCEIYKTAEAYHLAELFINRYTSNATSGIVSRQSEWEHYDYVFYVPQLYTETDNDANIAAKYWDNKVESVKIGAFIGSNGLNAASTIEMQENDNLNYTIDLRQNYSSWQSNCRSFIGNSPHVHALGKGRTNLIYGTLGAAAESVTLPNNFVTPSLNDNVLNDPSEISSTILKTDYRGTPDLNDKVLIPGDMMNNYVLFEATDESISWKEVANTFSGTLGNELTNGDGSIFKWYGRTSEPIWTANNITSKTKKFESQSTHAGYFRPESIKLLPLIKL